MFWSIGAYAGSPFGEGDFVSVSGLLGDLEVQKHELTYAQWNILNSELPSENQTPWGAEDCYLKEYIEKGFGPNYAAACISWNDARAYIKVLNKKDPNYSYRLPSSLELGKLIDMSLSRLRFNGAFSDKGLARYAWYYPLSDSHAHEVCTKESIFDLCDVLGNLWEWTNTSSGSLRVIHGGSWSLNALYLRSATRRNGHPDGRHSSVGFRLVRTPK